MLRDGARLRRRVILAVSVAGHLDRGCRNPDRDEHDSADAREGVRSFLEKRAPAFPDTVGADMPDFYPWWDEPGYA